MFKLSYMCIFVMYVGSTATVCLVQDNYMLHIGHVGDSRAILCRENTVDRDTYPYSYSFLYYRVPPSFAEP